MKNLETRHKIYRCCEDNNYKNKNNAKKMHQDYCQNKTIQIFKSSRYVTNHKQTQKKLTHSNNIKTQSRLIFLARKLSPPSGDLKQRQHFNMRHSSRKANMSNDSRNQLGSLLTSVIISISVLIYAIITSCLLVPTTTLAATSISASDNGNSLSLLTKTNTGQQQISTFSTPNQAINITHVTYDPLYDAVYLGATNTIYQLNGSDLNVLFEQTTGPIFDNPNCGTTECRGFEDYMKPTQNVNKVLVIDYQHRKLLSCDSTKQGACRRYQLNNIAQKEDLIPMAVAANDDNSSTYAFIAPARYTYDPSTTSSSIGNSNNNNNNLMQQQQVLYVASTYTKIGQSRELLVPAIGTRILDDGPNLLKLYENSFLDSARIDINSHLRDYFLVNYLYGFASLNYIYFVTVQKKATSRDFEELGYHTRLARICITDSSYNSYTEVDLKCMPNKRKSANQQQKQQQQPSEYPLLQDAILVDAGSQLLQSLAQNDQTTSSSSFLFGHHQSGTTSASQDDNKVLLGVFSSARDHTQHPGDHSAICAFSLSQIEDKFNDNIHSCYTGKMQSRNMEYIAGNVQECPKNGQGGNVVNFCHETLKINGTIPIVSEASIQFTNTTLTAITATSHVNSQAKNIYSEQLANELSIGSAIGPNFKKDPIAAASFGHHHVASGARQHTVVFVGTSNGHLKKILLNNATNGVEFDHVQLDTNPILSDLHLHSSGQHLIAATPYKVMKVPTHSCAQYSNCRECSQSRNPYCGWCSLRKSCTTKSECGGPQVGAMVEQTAGAAGSASSSNRQLQQQQQQQPKWISFDSAGKCIDLQAIVPDKIPMISTGKIDLYIDRLPRLPHGHSYKCVFNRSEQTSATPTANGLSCPLPKLMDRQKYIQIEPGKDHAIVDLAVRSSETNRDFLDGKIAFFECQRHTSCQDCLSTNWGCNWCLNENVCLFNATKCEKSPGSSGTARGAAEEQLATSARPLVATTVVTTSAAALSQNQLRGSTVITTPRQAAHHANTISLVQQCPNYEPTMTANQQADILISDASELSSRDRGHAPQFKQQQRANRPHLPTSLLSGQQENNNEYSASVSSSPLPTLMGSEQLGRRMHLQQQHQQQQEALFTSTIWTPHLRQPYQHIPGGVVGQLPPPLTPFNQPAFVENSPFDDLQTQLQQATPATKQQQLQTSEWGGALLYGLLVSLSLIVSLALLALVLVGLGTSNQHHHRLTRQPLDKLNALRNWFLQRTSVTDHNRRRCLHHRHLHASECAKCNQSATSSPDESAASPWPIVGSGFGSSTNTNSSGILGTLRGPQGLAGHNSGSSIIVGLNPIARLGQHQQHHHHQGNKTISGHIKQQFCFATQASKVAAVIDNYGLGNGAIANGANHGYYSAMNYAGESDFTPAAYQRQPPTADLLGTGYQCQQQQQHFAAPSVYHIATLGHNNNNTAASQTTRLIWQQSPNGTNSNGTDANGGSYLVDGGAYMPLSSNSSGGNAAANGQAHSGSGSPIYQTIYG